MMVIADRQILVRSLINSHKEAFKQTENLSWAHDTHDCIG